MIGWTPRLGINEYLSNSLKRNQPAIGELTHLLSLCFSKVLKQNTHNLVFFSIFVCLGVSLVVMCICTEVQVEHFYLCFACEECFPESSLRQHFSSGKHLIHTLVSFEKVISICCLCLHVFVAAVCGCQQYHKCLWGILNDVHSLLLYLALYHIFKHWYRSKAVTLFGVLTHLLLLLLGSDPFYNAYVFLSSSI